MEKVALILLLAIGGSMGFSPFGSCDVKRCTEEIPEKDIFDNFPPSPEKLREFCPPIMKTIRCLSEIVFACTGRPLVAWAGSDNESIAEMASLFLNAGSIVTDLCDEESNLHKGYVDGYSCFMREIREIAEGCIEEGRQMYVEFKLPLTMMELDDRDEGECMVAGYSLACSAKKLRDSCSAETAITFLQIVKRSKALKYGACSPKDVVTLRSEFLDFLEEQGESRDLLSVAFDFRRK